MFVYYVHFVVCLDAKELAHRFGFDISFINPLLHFYSHPMNQSEEKVSHVYAFGYGSNMSSKCLSWKGVDIEAGKSKASVLRGYRRFFAHPSGMANILPDDQAEVYGVTHLMSAEAKAKLDMAEGGDAHYDKATVKIEFCDGSGSIMALVYSYRGDPSEIREGIPTARYLSILLEGAIEFELPAHEIEKLTTHNCQPNKPAHEWKPLPDLHPDLPEIDIDALAILAKDKIVVVFFGRVCECSNNHDDPNTFKIVEKVFRGKNITPMLQNNFYFPGLSDRDQHDLFLHDYFAERLAMRIIGKYVEK